MNESIISVRYTKALFSLALDKDMLDVVKNDMETVYVVMNESKELQQVFQNPVLKPSNKNKIINLIFKSFNKITISFIGILIKNRREEYLHDISRNFLEKYKQYKGIETTVLTTAVSVDNEMLEKVKELIKKVIKKEIDISNQIDDRIIGGFLIRVGDRQIDASVQSHLSKIKRKLLDTTIN